MAAPPDIAADYHRLLERAPEEHLALLEAAARAAGIGEVPTFARPCFVAEADRAWAAKATGHLHSAMNRLVRAWHREGLFADQVRLHPRALSLAHSDASREQPLVFTRYDAVFEPTSRRLAFLECQAGDPSGMGWHDALVRALAGLPALKELGRHRLLSAGLLAASQRKVMDEEHRARSPAAGEPPRLVFACATGSFVRSDHELLAADARAAGRDAQVADPGELELRGGALLLGGASAPLVFRDTIDELVLDGFFERAGALLEAHRTGAALVLNPFCCVVADDKVLFEALTDERWDSLFSAEEREVLRAHVPLTRVLGDRRVSLRGESVELLEQLRSHREGWVLKPADGYGGFGVVVGADLSQARWEHALAAALASGRTHVAQEYVPLPEEEFPLCEGGRYAGLGRRRVVASFWWHRGRFAGGFARAAKASVINVHQGGGIVPMVFHREGQPEPGRLPIDGPGW